MAICPSHTFLCRVQLTPLFLSLPVLPKTQLVYHLALHHLELLGLLNPHLHQFPIQFPSLHSEVFHSCYTESQYTPSVCSLSLLVLSTVFLSHPLLPHS